MQFYTLMICTVNCLHTLENHVKVFTWETGTGSGCWNCRRSRDRHKAFYQWNMKLSAAVKTDSGDGQSALHQVYVRNLVLSFIISKVTYLSVRTGGEIPQNYGGTSSWNADWTVNHVSTFTSTPPLTQRDKQTNRCPAVTPVTHSLKDIHQRDKSYLKRNHLWEAFILTFAWLALSANTEEEGLMSCTVASHQGASGAHVGHRYLTVTVQIWWKSSCTVGTHLYSCLKQNFVSANEAIN